MSSSNAVPDIVVSGQKLDVGDTAKITINTKDSDAELADPTTLSVKVKPPSTSATTYEFGTDSELTKTSTGVYQLLYPIGVSGTHHVRAITTGNAGAEPGYFYARPDNTV